MSDPVQIPDALRKKLSEGVELASAMRKASFELKSAPAGKRSDESRRIAGGLFYRFKHAIADVNARFDTISLLLGEEAASALAEALGCSWDRQSRKVVLGPPKRSPAPPAPE